MIIDSHEHLMLPINLQLKKMENAGIDKVILFCTAPHPEKAKNYQELKTEMESLYKVLAGTTTKYDNLIRMKKNIDEIVNVIKKYPDKFYGFGSVPLGLSLEDTDKWIEEQIIYNGLKGVGEFTPGTDKQIQELEVIFQSLEKFPKLPIWVHTFNPVSMNGINILMDLTKKYPKVPVIFGHMGGYHWMKVIDFAKSVPNAYIDLSASFSTLALKMAISELPDKCLFSSDAPYGEPLLNIQTLEYLCPSEKIKSKILGENIMRILNEVKN
ncbi:amidohydrolase family protein [Clostridioides difficile]|nr:amidohydrolase family protein [Clostridioides difficile]